MKIEGWNALDRFQKNTRIAEYVDGWQWIKYDFPDVFMEGQRWLLPSGESIADLSPGEWTWYLDEPEVYPEGSLFPLPHQDKRIVPYWIPNYTGNMDRALEILRSVVQREDVDPEVLSEELWKTTQDNLTPFEAIKLVCMWTPERVCLAALRACRVEISDE